MGLGFCSIARDRRVGRRRLAILAPTLLLMLAVLSLAVAPSASATPTVGHGDCWRSSAPESCPNAYHLGQYLHVSVQNQVGASLASVATAISFSNPRWSAVSGSQYLNASTTPTPYTVIYTADQYPDAAYGITSPGVYAITWYIKTDGSASTDLNTTGVIDHVRIFVNNYAVAHLNQTQQDVVLMHEMGHALGLQHSSSSSDLLTSGLVGNGNPYISANDVGASPACSGSPTNGASETAGVRCVYDWSNWA